MEFSWMCVDDFLTFLLSEWSHSVVSDSQWSHGLQPTRILCPWNFPGKNSAVGSHSLLKGIFPIQGSNPDLPHCRRILYHLSHQGRMPAKCSMNANIVINNQKYWAQSTFASIIWKYTMKMGMCCFIPLSAYHNLYLFITCRFGPWIRKITWRRKWQPTPVFFTGKFHGQRSPLGYGPWGHRESDATEHTPHA